MSVGDGKLLHSVFGGMTTDYFDFFCKECGAPIPYVDFYGLDSVGVRLMTKCDGCGLISIFKIKTTIMLGPIQVTDEFGKRSFKAYDKRRLRKYRSEIEAKVRCDDPSV